MRRSKGEKVFQVFNVLFMFLLCVIMLYPYLNQVAISLNEGLDAMRGGITIFPRKFTWVNYSTILQSQRIINGAIISVSRTIIGTLLALAVLFCAAFAITRQGLPYKRGITLYLMIPAYIGAGLIPTYILFRTLGLINNFWVYILPGLFSFYNMVILRSFLQELPPSLDESAKLDGANEIQIMWHISIPLSKPVLATLALWQAVAHWNCYSDALLYVTDRDLYPLTYIMMQLIKESSVAQQMASESANSSVAAASAAKPTSETIKAATLIVTTIPIIMIYPFLQRYFIKGVTLGAVKG